MKIIHPVCLIIVNDNNEVLLLKRSKEESVCPGLWSILGGGVEEGESYEEAMIREVKEETSCHVSELNFFKSYFFDNPEPAARPVYFYGKIEGNIKLNEENDEFEWFNKDNIPENLAFNQNIVLKDFFDFLE